MQVKLLIFDMIFTFSQASYDKESVNEIEIGIAMQLTEAVKIIICKVS